jgi:hypothetical protein
MRVHLRLAAIVAAFVLASAVSFPHPTAAAAPDYHFMSDGDSASLSWWKSDGTNGWVSVSRYNSSLSSAAWLNYQISGPGTFESFAGGLPASALTGDAARGMTLAVDTSGACPVAPCSRNGAGGVISLTWVRTNLNHYTSSGRTEYSYTTPYGATLTFRSIGTSNGSSASATGSVFGVPPTGDNLWGSMSRNHNVTFTYEEQP